LLNFNIVGRNGGETGKFYNDTSASKEECRNKCDAFKKRRFELRKLVGSEGFDIAFELSRFVGH